jgi:hypothetical protein
MSLPTFADLTKNVKDLLTKELPGEKSKIELTTNTANGNIFVSSLTRTFADDTYVGLFNPKFKRPEHGLTGNVSVDTKGELKAEVAVADQLVPGLKVTLNGVTGPEQKVAPAKISLEYKSGNTATATAALDLFHPSNGTTFTGGLVLGYEGFLGALEAQVLAEKQELASVSVGAGYKNSEFEAHIVGTQKGEALTAKVSYYHIINSAFKVGGEVALDAKKFKETPPSFEFGGWYQIDSDSSVKVKANAQGVVGWSFTQALSKNVKVTLGGSVNAKKLKEGGEHKVGLELVLSS